MSGPGYIREIFLGRPLSEDSWLNRLPALAQLRAGERLAFDSPVTFLVGENGAGKSTLLEGIAVACGFNPEGGTRNFHPELLLLHPGYPLGPGGLSHRIPQRLPPGRLLSPGGELL